MALKAFLALAALAAIAIGFLLPTPGRTPDVRAESQIPTVKLGPA